MPARVLSRLLPTALLAAATHVVAADALPEIHASAPTARAVTIYRDDLALVTETRSIDLPSGPSRVLFDGVMDRLIPSAVIIQGLDEINERNFDFNGLSPRSLLWHALGETVQVSTTTLGHRMRSSGEHTERAVIDAAGDGLLLRYADRIEALGCSGLPERLIFERVPDQLRARPTLSANLAAGTPGPRTVTLSYLVTGMAWKTDYDLELAADGTHATLSAWLSLTNTGTQALPDAAVGVIAGELSRVWLEPMALAVSKTAARACWPMGRTTDMAQRMYKLANDLVMPPPAAPPMAMAMRAVEEVVVTGGRVAEREAVGDYQLYRLPFSTDVLAAQTKQVMLLQARRIAIERLYSHRGNLLFGAEAGELQTRATQVLLRARNDTAHGLGEPLPGGTVRIFTPHPEFGALLTDQGTTVDTAVATNWRIELGTSPAVTVQSRMLASSTREHLFDNGATLRGTFEHELSNATNAAQIFEFSQTSQLNTGASSSTPHIGTSSDPWTMQDGSPTWRIELPANSTHLLRYELSVDVQLAADE